MTALARGCRAAADDRDFERAAVYRDQIRALAKVQTRQYVDTAKALRRGRRRVRDRSGHRLRQSGDDPQWAHLGDKSFFPQHAEERTDGRGDRRRSSPSTTCKVRRRLIVASEEVDAEELGRGAQRACRPSGPDRDAAAGRAARLARDGRAQRQPRRSRSGRASRAPRRHGSPAMREALGLPPSAQRIECFDVSHTQGELTVASVRRLRPVPAAQRRSTATTTSPGSEPGDDYAAMRDVLDRRYEKVVAGRGRWSRPDPDRWRQGPGERGAWRCWRISASPTSSSSGWPRARSASPVWRSWCSPRATASLRLDKDHPGLHLIQQIRDEAHRFAITGHRERRAKKRGHLDAGVDRRDRREAPPAAARALRRPEGRDRCQRRRAGAGGRYQPDAGRAHLPGAALMPLNVPNLLTWLRILADPAARGDLLSARTLARAAREEPHRDDPVRRRGGHRLAGRLPGAQARTRPRRSAPSSIRSPTS